MFTAPVHYFIFVSTELCNSATLHICLKILDLNLVEIVINFELFGTYFKASILMRALTF